MTAVSKRKEQLRSWEESETSRISALARSSSGVSFSGDVKFLAACSAGDTVEAKQLLQQGVNVDTTTADGLSALHQSCIDDNLILVEFLVENGANVNLADVEGWTPLHATLYCGFISIAKYLIEHGADISLVNYDCQLPIDLCKCPQLFDLVKCELDRKGYDCNELRSGEENRIISDAKRWMANNSALTETRHPTTGALAIHVAAAKGYKEALMLLLKAGVDINAQDFEGWTPLHAAVYWRQEEICELLVLNHCNMNIQNFNGLTPMEIAYDDICDLLEELQDKQTELASTSADIKKLINRSPLSNVRDMIATSSGTADTHNNVTQTRALISSAIISGNKHPPISSIQMSCTKTAHTDTATRTSTLMSTADTRTQTLATTRVVTSYSDVTCVSAQSTPTVARDTQPTSGGNVGPVAAHLVSASTAGDSSPAATRVCPVTHENSTLVSTTPSSALQTSSAARKSFVPPSREEESETKRKAHAKRVRETRRSTQGVTLEEIKSAEQYIKNQQQQKKHHDTELSVEAVTGVATTSISTTISHANSTQGDHSVNGTTVTSTAVCSALAVPASSCTSRFQHVTSSAVVCRPTPAHSTCTQSTRVASLSAGTAVSAATDRRPSWRLKMDVDRNKFTLEDIKASGDTPATTLTTVSVSKENINEAGSTPYFMRRTNTPFTNVAITSSIASYKSAFSGHTMASSGHTMASSGHIVMSPGYTVALSGHKMTSSNHTVASSGHTAASSVYTVASSGHTAASSGHTVASSGHTVASSVHTVASSGHTAASSAHTVASSAHTVASSVYTVASSAHTVTCSTGMDSIPVSSVTQLHSAAQKYVACLINSSNNNSATNAVNNNARRKRTNVRRPTGIVQISHTDSGSIDANSPDIPDEEQNDYKRLYKEAMCENESLKQKLSALENDYYVLKAEASITHKNKNEHVENDVVDAKSNVEILQQKLLEAEEKLIAFDKLRNENTRLHDENGALVRVISKLSK